MIILLLIDDYLSSNNILEVSFFLKIVFLVDILSCLLTLSYMYFLNLFSAMYICCDSKCDFFFTSQWLFTLSYMFFNCYADGFFIFLWNINVLMLCIGICYDSKCDFFKLHSNFSDNWMWK